MKRYILPLAAILLFSSSAALASTGIIKKSNYIYKSGEVIVKVKQGISQGLLKSSAGGGALPELAKVSVSKTANAIENNAAFENIYTIEYSSPQDPEALAKELDSSQRKNVTFHNISGTNCDKFLWERP
ncbi:MAG TPA: hypothetical protein VHP30_05465 [Ignavibacteriales bacterium]|nr:hypothetical protein [Ignavibacteriales bacterium]